MKTIQLIFALLVSAMISNAQLNYDDVAVIMNSNSNASMETGTYFAQQRSIPDENLIYIDCMDQELIDTLEFRNIVDQLRLKLSENNLSENINYLVTTTGIPLHYSKDNYCDSFPEAARCRSVDNRIGLVNSSWVSDILHNDFGWENPYYQSMEKFDAAAYEMYLVSRLDGFSVDSIKAMIDRSGPNIGVVKEEANVLLDLMIADTGTFSIFNDYLSPSIEFLEQNNWNYLYHDDTSLLEQQDNILMYFGFVKERPGTDVSYTWSPGSIAVNAGSTADFYYEQKQLSTIGLLNSGATSSMGYSDPYYFSMAITPEILFERYLSDSLAFNLTESMYAAFPDMGFNYVVIGDPKTSLNLLHAGVSEENLLSADIKLFPNPANDYVNIASPTVKTAVQLVVLNHLGQIVYRQENVDLSGKGQKINTSGLNSGMYFIRIIDEEGNSGIVKCLVD